MRVFLVLATLALALVGGSAQAASPWTVEATLASEYISKGAGRSDGQPHAALQAQRRLTTDTYGGAWAGTLRSPLGADGEAHLYAGWRPELAGWRLDVRPMLKVLIGARGGQTEQWEFRLDAARAFGPNRLRLRVEQAPDGYGPSRASTWMEAAVSRRIADTPWSLTAGLGRREFEIGRGYTAWNAGVQRRLGERATLEVRWIDTDLHAAGREYDGRLVASLTANLD